MCSDENGKLTIQSDWDRETMMGWCIVLNIKIPTKVIRVFDDPKDAILYIEDIELVNELIESL